MKHYLNLNFITGCSHKGHYAIPVSREFFLSFMDRIMRDGYIVKTFVVNEVAKATYYCVYDSESESDVSDHVCFDDLNVVGLILHS